MINIARSRILSLLVMAVLALAAVVALATVTQPCESEDSQLCMWEAQTQGNGQGTSFWAGPGEVVVYLP